VPADHFYAFKETLEKYSFMRGIRLNIAVEQDDHSFLKLTIKVRDKIVADGLDDKTFDVTDKGIHLGAKEFNALLEDENTIVVDMRNHYESEIGHFVNAIKPDVDTFRESLPIIEEQLAPYKEDKNVLMYCTGGIRCEKASAYFKHKGFKNVFQLEGGIIEYARQVKADGLESKFIGKNFVFDHRLGERITDHIVAQCHQCGAPCDNHTNCANEACHLLFIQCEKCANTLAGCCSSDCFEVNLLPADEQKLLRKGKMNGNKVFKKGKSPVLTFKSTLSEETATIGNWKARTAPKNTLRKKYVGKTVHYYPKIGVGDFLIHEQQIITGDTIIIKGPTTGAEILKIEQMHINGKLGQHALPGDVVSLKLPFRVRLSDKLYIRMGED
jgi:UPF0176 protein